MFEKLLAEALGHGAHEKQGKRGTKFLMPYKNVQGNITVFNFVDLMNGNWPTFGPDSDGEMQCVSVWPTERGWRLFKHSNSYNLPGKVLMHLLAIIFSNSEHEADNAADSVEMAREALGVLRDHGFVDENGMPAAVLSDPAIALLPKLVFTEVE